MDWFRRMSERDRLNSILPFFLPAVHVDFTSTSAPRIYTLEIMVLESSRDFYQIFLQRFANQSWNGQSRRYYESEFYRRENIWRENLLLYRYYSIFDFDSNLTNRFFSFLRFFDEPRTTSETKTRNVNRDRN